MPEIPNESQQDGSETPNILKWIAMIAVLSVAMLLLLAWLGPTLGSMMRTTYTSISSTM